MVELVTGPFRATRGIIVGCSVATTLIRVFVVKSIEKAGLPCQVRLDMYIDDYGISVTGSDEVVYEKIVKGSAIIRDVILSDLHGQVAIEKAALAASSSLLASRILAELGDLAGAGCNSAVNLGIDHACGRAFRASGRSKKFK
eukprot:8103534-Pyramimonas_sp.AAC.1